SSRRRHARFSRDWSSDVCSSDLCSILILDYDPIWRLEYLSMTAVLAYVRVSTSEQNNEAQRHAISQRYNIHEWFSDEATSGATKIGRASSRERVWYSQYVDY